MENNLIKIKNIVESITLSMNQNNHFSSMTNSLILIDICSKIYLPDEVTNHKRYQTWIEDHYYSVIEELEEHKHYLSSDNIWHLRNAMLHQGSSNPNTNSTYQRYGTKLVKDIVPTVFLDTTKHKAFVADLGDEYPTLFFDVNYFCETILDSAVSWIIENASIIESSNIHLFSIGFEIESNEEGQRIVRL